MNIRECIDLLTVSAEAIGGAPEKGFLDLDNVRDSILKARLFLDEISAQYELGIKLKEDVVASLESKINALKTAGYAQLFGPTEKALASDKLDFEQIKSIQTEIDGSLARCFGALKIPTVRSYPANLNDYR